MKRKILSAIFITLSLIFLISCKATTRSPGNANISFKLSKEWKQVSTNKIYKYMLGDSSGLIQFADQYGDFNDKSFVEEYNYIKNYKKNEKKNGVKISGFIKKNKTFSEYDINSFICIKCIKTSKIEKKLNTNIKNTDDYFVAIKGHSPEEDSFARSFYVDNYKIIHYVDAASITEQLIFVDKKYAYIIIIEADDNFSNESTSNLVRSTLKINVHGIKDGFIDGLLFCLKAICNIFKKDIRFFAIANNGLTYMISFIVGLIIEFILFILLFNKE